MSAEGTPAAGGTGTPWYDAVIPKDAAGVPDKVTMDYFTNRGYDKMDAPKAAMAAMEAHRAAERLIGVPANDILKVPKDATDVEAWSRFNERIGVPKEAKEYDFSSLKPTQGDLDAKLVADLAPALQKAHVSKADAPVVLKAVLDHFNASKTVDAAAAEQALNVERETLKVNWGANLAQNMLVAKNTAKTLGVDEAAVSALEKQIGYAKVMDMFAKIGVKLGEDKLILNQSPGGNGYMSQEQAQATLNEKMADNDWATKFSNGDTQAMKEFHNLTQLISGKAA